MTPRLLAFDLLCKAEKSKQYSNIALDGALLQSGMSDADRALASALFYGVIERRITLDYQLAKLSSRELCQLDRDVLIALRLGLYQLMYMDRIPDHAAINETVDLCPRKKAGFVNAILRSYTRTGASALPSKETDPVEYLSAAYSVSPLLCEKLMGVYGFETSESILEGIGAIPPTTLRVNTLNLSREELAERIAGATPTEYSQNGLRVRGAVRELYGFEEGSFFVQDEASQICVEALGACEGETMLDICACPGSKSFGSAIRMNNKGRIIAFDLHENKLSLITSNAKRLGIDIIETRAQDGRVFIPELSESADRVLCDVPCSGFGVLAKKPELRYKDPKESEALPKIQYDILNNACRYVKRGGTLVYSTCTIFPEENEENLKKFLSSHPDFELCPFSVGSLDVPSGYITFLPSKNYSIDGFFISKLTRR